MKKVIRTCVEEQYPNHRFEVELTLCGDEEIHGINKEFRGIDRPTDVLSFPMMEFSMPRVYVSLGNIVLSVETARRQAEEYGHSLKRELCFLCAHSALHLLGYDHETEDEREEMEAKQREILDALGIKR
ncbi:MAG: rRNA maturation RNase YbeY [Clostridia bacterium]|nr:rRNA maturation RNase YbeY [Clostridia bacterium]